MALLENSSDPETRLMAIANGGQEHAYALVGQAYYVYMGDLRSVKHVDTLVELAIWAILSNRSDLLDSLDRAFEKYIDKNHEEKLRELFDEVFE